MSNQWFDRTLGEEFGPVSEETLKGLMSDGIVGETDEIRQGAGQWTTISTLTSPTNQKQSQNDSIAPQPPQDQASRKAMREVLEYLHDRDVRLAGGSRKQTRPSRGVSFESGGLRDQNATAAEWSEFEI